MYYVYKCETLMGNRSYLLENMGRYADETVICTSANQRWFYADLGLNLFKMETYSKDFWRFVATTGKCDFENVITTIRDRPSIETEDIIKVFMMHSPDDAIDRLFSEVTNNLRIFLPFFKTHIQGDYSRRGYQFTKSSIDIIM